MQTKLFVENKDTVKFEVTVQEFEQFAMVFVDFDKRYEHYSTHYRTPQLTDYDLTLGVFPANFEELDIDSSVQWYKEMPRINIKFHYKYSGWVFEAADKEVNAFALHKSELYLGDDLVLSSAVFRQ